MNAAGPTPRVLGRGACAAAATAALLSMSGPATAQGFSSSSFYHEHSCSRSPHGTSCASSGGSYGSWWRAPRRPQPDEVQHARWNERLLIRQGVISPGVATRSDGGRGFLIVNP
jgi:hypothetical protein